MLSKTAQIAAQPGGQPHRIAQAVDDPYLPVLQARDDQVKTVGAEVHRRDGRGCGVVWRGQ